MKHVILGNGTAGVIAAETLRKNAPADDIILIGDEAEPPYSRGAIPHLIAGEITEAGTWLRRNTDYFARLRIEQRTGRAVHLSTRTRTLKMEDGSVIAFDRLLIATGASPRPPAFHGMDLPGVHACWTLDDARRIMERAMPRARVVLIGAGFIGCIVMEALAARGVQLTVIERRERMLPSLLSDGAGRIVQKWCERKGIKVRTGTRVLAIGGDAGGPRVVRMANGEHLQADLVVHCAGTRPNIDFL
ncbi:NAD(P)/FAD-dependent oxidoreductase, partial [Oxalobacteraceae bacterium OM1]